MRRYETDCTPASNITRIVDIFKCSTAVECIITNTCYTVTNCYACKSCTAAEYIIADACYAVTDCHTCKSCTAAEYIITDACYAVTDCHTCKSCTAVECIITDACYTVGNKQLCNQLTTDIKIISIIHRVRMRRYETDCTPTSNITRIVDSFKCSTAEECVKTYTCNSVFNNNFRTFADIPRGVLVVCF